jgi:hypothetical protein
MYSSGGEDAIVEGVAADVTLGMKKDAGKESKDIGEVSGTSNPEVGNRVSRNEYRIPNETEAQPGEWAVEQVGIRLQPASFDVQGLDREDGQSVIDSVDC